jgi:quercetin dioxygenase-like cupin family protein
MQAELVVDAPGKTYPQHAHEETLLVGLFGWAAIRLENEEWRILHPRDDLLIRSGVVHEAVVGDNGWGYLAGTFKRRS